MQFFIKTFPWRGQSQGESERQCGRVQRTLAAPFTDLLRRWPTDSERAEEYGKALLACMRVLFKTRLDVARGEFKAAWPSPGLTLPHRLVLQASEYGWTQVLADTTSGCAVALIRTGYLRAPNAGRLSTDCQCVSATEGKPLSSILKAALYIRPGLAHGVGVKARAYASDSDSQWQNLVGIWAQVWDVSSANQGAKIWLPATRLTLHVCEAPSDSHLQLERASRVNGLWRKLTEEGELGHWEYLGEGRSAVRPLPVHIK